MSKALATKNIAALLLGIGMILSVFAFATPASETRPEPKILCPTPYKGAKTITCVVRWD